LRKKKYFFVFLPGKLWSAAVRQAQEMELLESNRAFPDQVC